MPILTELQNRIAAIASTFIALVAVLAAVSQCGAKDAAEKRAARSDKLLVSAQANLSACQDNNVTLQGAVDRQNASLVAVREESARKVEESEKAAQGALKSAKTAEAKASRLLGVKLGGIDVCARTLGADDAFVRELSK